MVSALFFSQLGLIALVWLCVMLPWAWPSDTAVGPPSLEPPLPKRHRAPPPCAGLTTKPHCDACAQGSAPRPHAPAAPPPRLALGRGRRRQVETSTHCCPHPDGASRGGGGGGHRRAQGHPSGGPWRPRLGLACRRAFLETRGTRVPGQRASVARIVPVRAGLAAGLGRRGPACVCAVDPPPGLQGLGEAADQRRACAHPVRHAGRGGHVQRAALFARLRAAEARARLERSPAWGGGALAPASKRRRRDLGEPPLVRAHRLGPHVAPVGASDWAPLVLTAGVRAS